jgi:hypothetical protein
VSQVEYRSTSSRAQISVAEVVDPFLRSGTHATYWKGREEGEVDL